MNKEEIEKLKAMELKAKGGRVSVTLEGLIKLEDEIKKRDELIHTMQAEFERLENLEDNTDMLKIELKKKNKRISNLEYALVGMIMQFANRPKIKDCYYALSTMGLSALETAFAELEFNDPMPVAEAEKKYKILVYKYFEKEAEE